ncbi:polymorphic toxin type 44 domain-containing protein [Anaerocolumna chitinilytica]|uniref:Bacterial toxin 44 domain-containing protein n=1 Tax=Anaerocolumna chitinilytica TaxID=1727145 RepID=A0A7I8DMX6_9FIRM|nr:polymorphic toxin type 44 domain-containing protein [Anaerocolumna chitinilytica]BCJ98375.1 hypothetical protein bsdcttw_14160 [Anaerocolumna chitinilytica]
MTKLKVFLLIGSFGMFIFSGPNVLADNLDGHTSLTNQNMYLQEEQPLSSDALFERMTDEVKSELSISKKATNNITGSTYNFLDSLEKQQYDSLSNIDGLTNENKLILAKAIVYRYREAQYFSELANTKLEQISQKEAELNIPMAVIYNTDMRVAAYYVDNVKVADKIYDDYLYLLALHNGGTAVAYRNAIFIMNVKTGGPWDLKQYLGLNNYYMLLNNNRTGEYIGNHHFGYMGEHCGFALSYLQFGAGLYQIVSGTSDWSFVSSYFDDPRDSAAISDGYSNANIDVGYGIFY